MIVTISCVGDTRKGDKYYKEKSYKKAIIAYSDYLNRHKPTVLVLYQRGRSFEEIGEMLDKASDLDK